MKRHVRSALVISILLAAALRAWAGAGDLDPTFGNAGIIIQGGLGAGEIDALTLQPDGKLVAAGSSDSGLTLARYNTNGTLDATFANGGVMTTSRMGTGMGVVLQPDGKLVVGGMSPAPPYYWDVALARFNNDGSLDPTFGSGGITTTAVSAESDYLNALVLQPDGKLVATGYSSFATSSNSSRSTNKITLLRYNADGSLDQGFGTGGVVTTQISHGIDVDDGASAAALQPDGKIVVGATSCVDGGCQWEILRYQSDGRLDLQFGKRGIVDASPGPLGGGLASLVLRSDGKIVGAGFVSGGEAICALMRFNPDGSLDSSFGSAGIAETSGHLIPQALAQRADGALLVAGYGWLGDWDGSSTDFGIARFTAGGILDRQFGHDGIAMIDTSRDYDMVHALAVQPDNKFVVGGVGTLPDHGGFVWTLARLADGSCGDGRVETGEDCDDGNLTDGDGCDSNCTVTKCGNGITSAGEQCDDGNQHNDDACKNDCTLNVCGDGVVRTGVEICDDGNAVDDDGCNNTCQRTRCGDGVKDPSEECDDGNAANGDGCDTNCLVEQCGNGRVEGGEQCDSGSPTGDTQCSPDCHFALEYDTVLSLLNPLTVKLGVGHDELTRYVPIRLDAAGGQVPRNHVVQLTASDGDCPAGTVDASAGPIRFVTNSARVFIHVQRAAFTNATAATPQRCTLRFTAAVTPADVYDPAPQNNSASLELNVFDFSQEQTSRGVSFSLQSVKPQRARIARGVTTATKTVRLTVTTTSPDPTRTVTITAQDGTCPSGTVGQPAPGAVTLARRRAIVLLPLTVSHAAFQSKSRNSPSRCTASVTAALGNGSQQTIQVVLDVMDGNGA